MAEPVYATQRRLSVWLSFVASVSAIPQGHSAGGCEMERALDQRLQMTPETSYVMRECLRVRGGQPIRGTIGLARWVTPGRQEWLHQGSAGRRLRPDSVHPGCRRWRAGVDRRRNGLPPGPDRRSPPDARPPAARREPDRASARGERLPANVAAGDRPALRSVRSTRMSPPVAVGCSRRRSAHALWPPPRGCTR